MGCSKHIIDTDGYVIPNKTIGDSYVLGVKPEQVKQLKYNYVTDTIGKIYVNTKVLEYHNATGVNKSYLEKYLLEDIDINNDRRITNKEINEYIIKKWIGIYI